MKPTKRTDNQVESTLTGEKIGFTLDDNPEHLMNMLTDVYSDPVKAIIREYSTNARDSHKDAGITRPIEVTTPTALQPNLIIQDFGLGLDIEDMREIYTKYGASTKRDSDDFTGMLGIGSKSALAYAEQFTVVSIKSGRQIQASVAKDDRGIPVMTIVSEKTTSDHDGVKIIIPSSGNENFEQKAKTLFSYWDKGTVLLNGREPERVDGIKLSDKFLIADYSGGYLNEDSRHTVVMGSVPYPIPDRIITFDVSRSKRIIIFAEIGSVAFPNSREELLDIKVTREYLAEAKKEFDVLLAKYMNTALEKHNDRYTVFAKAIEIKQIKISSWNTTIEGMVWKNETLPKNYVIDYSDKENYFRITSPGGYASASATHMRLDTKDWQNCFYIENFNLKKYTAGHKEKVRQYLQIKKNLSQRIVLFPKEVPDVIKKWVDPNNICDWKDDVLPATKTTKATKPADTYYRFDSTNYLRVKAKGIHADNLNGVKNPFYFHKPVFSDESYSSDMSKIEKVKTYLESKYPDTAFCLVEGNRISRLQKIVPKIKDGHKVVLEDYEAWKKSLTDDQIAAIYGTIQEENILNALYVAEEHESIKDPKVKKIIDKFKIIKGHKKDKKLNSESAIWRNLGFKEYSNSVKLAEDVKSKYPLVFTSNSFYSTPDKNLAKDISLYINTKHKQVGIKS